MTYNPSLHLTKPFVTRLACARPAPNSFAGETNVIQMAVEAMSGKWPWNPETGSLNRKRYGESSRRDGAFGV